ncbi:MAG: cyanophycinase [Gemmatimonadota bacterium]
MTMPSFLRATPAGAAQITLSSRTALGARVGRAVCSALVLAAPLALALPGSSAMAQAARASTAAAAAPEYGPPNGTLVIAGGGNLQGTGIMERFIELAGGPGARIVVVPTAGGNRDSKGALMKYDEADILKSWRARGLTNVHMLHTHDPAVANTEAFASTLQGATGVWFNGGRQWNIVDSYAKTRTYDAFHAVLARGGVIGGSSAGATIQGEYLVRGAVSGSDVMMSPEPEHQDAFRFLRRTAIDQHIDTRNRWNDLAPVMTKFPNLLGIGLSEGTAIVVRGDIFEVIGRGKVAVHDNTRKRTPGDSAYFTLSATDRYDMKSRQTIMPAGAARDRK